MLVWWWEARKKMFSRTILLGRLGADPEVRTAKSGSKIVGLRLATNRAVKVNEEWIDRTEWHSVSVFGSLAERVERNLRKGSLILVEGRLEYQQVGEGDQKKTYTKIIADSIQFVDGFGKSDSAEGQPTYERSPRDRQTKTYESKTTGQGMAPVEDDFDLPF